MYTHNPSWLFYGKAGGSITAYSLNLHLDFPLCACMQLWDFNLAHARQSSTIELHSQLHTLTFVNIFCQKGSAESLGLLILGICTILDRKIEYCQESHIRITLLLAFLYKPKGLQTIFKEISSIWRGVYKPYTVNTACQELPYNWRMKNTCSLKNDVQTFFSFNTINIQENKI